MKQLLTAAFVFLFTAGTVSAQAPHRNHQARSYKQITKVQKQQQQRIARGIHTGQLTAREAARLEQRQARLQHRKRLAKADGRFTARERAHLTRHQQLSSREIYIKKHNRARR